MMEALGDTQTVSVQSLVTEESIVKVLQELLPIMDAETTTLKLVMQKLAIRFGMEFQDLKAQWRTHLKAVLPEMLNQCMGGETSEAEGEKDTSGAEEEEEEVDLRPSRKPTQRTRKRNAVVDASDEEEEDDANENDASEVEEVKPEEDDEEEEEDDIAPPKKRRKSSANGHSKKTSYSDDSPVKKAKTAKQQDPPGLASLKELGRAAGVMNPRLYRLLKGATSDEDAEEILRERLEDAGVDFTGAYPSSRDISAAKRKHDKEKELEGMDMNLIISGGRSRRGVSEHISYKEEPISGAEEEDDDDDQDFGGSDSDSSEASI